MTTPDAAAAATVAELLGGRPVLNREGEEEGFEVVTQEAAVAVQLCGRGSVRTELMQWTAKGLVHHCDATEYLSPDGERGRPCGCPRLPDERRRRAREGRGPLPVTRVLFRLGGALSAGVFGFRSGSWEFAGAAAAIRVELPEGGPVNGRLVLRPQEWRGAEGGAVLFHRPLLEVRQSDGEWSVSAHGRCRAGAGDPAV
nr:hypothetical protein [Streptomyces sp. YIM 98790]